MSPKEQINQNLKEHGSTREARKAKRTISFSGFKNFIDCPFQYKLLYVDEVLSREKNIFSGFGSALHDVAENIILNKFSDNPQDKDWFNHFDLEFDYQLTGVDQSYPGFTETNGEKIAQFREQGRLLIPMILPGIDEYFDNDWTLVSTEYEFEYPIQYFKDFETDTKFVGIVDLIVESPVGSGRLHVLDYKSCSWGWDARKKSDKMTNYQMTFYKYFICQILDLPYKDVETHFVLLKRTAKKNNVEAFRTTSGPKRIDNAFGLLRQALVNIDRNFFPRNKLSCGNFGGCKCRGKFCK